MDIGKNEGLKIYVLADDYAGYNSPFLAQHGVSFLIEAESNGVKRWILFDTASYSEPILFNMKLLKLNPKNMDMIVLSHSHFDHTGGLLGIIKKINKNIPIFAHPDIFKISFSMELEFLYAGVPPIGGGTKEEIERQGGIWILSKDPIRLASGVFILGEIEREEKISFEKETSVHLYKIVDGRVVRDEVEDEIGLGIVTEKGLVVVVGCSHPGIISMVRKAIEISGVDEIYAIIGGFHLIDADSNRINKTIEALKKYNPKKIYAGHCTGLKAEAMFMTDFGDVFEKLHAGKVIYF